MPSAEILDTDDKSAFLVFENQVEVYTSIVSTAENVLFVCILWFVPLPCITTVNILSILYGLEEYTQETLFKYRPETWPLYEYTHAKKYTKQLINSI
jgi:hypothetical protein